MTCERTPVESTCMDIVALTIDIDWAPDFMIDFAAEALVEEGVRATWFVTHPSPAVDRLRQHPELFELGIHPNFLPRSTHGKRWEDVLVHCMDLVPDATSMRTHGLFQATALLDMVITQTPITTDLTIFLPYTASIRPVDYHWNDRTLLRLPYYWEDDFEMMQPNPSWSLTPERALGGGLKIFNFHPVHIFLNSPDMKPYRMYQRDFMNSGKELKATDAEGYVFDGTGSRTMFREVVDALAVDMRSSMRVSDIRRRWLDANMGANT